MVFGVAAATLLATSLTTVAAAGETGRKEVNNNTGQKYLIMAFSDGLRRDKYAVWDPVENRPYWYAQGGSANAGSGESGRHTSQNEWCRVRYLYGDDVRVPECWGGFMYSSHLITGMDGFHYELWFSPSSLSYYKIRNQEKDIWYAHDGSNHNPAKPTTKKDWCYVIIVHGKDILKIPNECQDVLSDLMKFSAGVSDGVKAAQVLNDLKHVLNLQTEITGNYYDIITDSNLQLKNLGRDIGLGMAVGYGTEAAKKKFNLTAKDANAGQIAAEVLTTSAVNTGLTSALSMAFAAAGVGSGGFNPISAGVGFVVGASVAGGQALYQASEDTGIQLYPNYGAHVRYNRDLNGITGQWVNPRPLPAYNRAKPKETTPVLFWSDGSNYKVTDYGYRTVSVAGQMPSVSGWDIAGMGDITGDGEDDILWFEKKSPFQVHFWEMKNKKRANGINIKTPVGGGWVPVGVADVDSDGDDDPIFFNKDTGEIYAWFMNGSTPNGEGIIGKVDKNEWTLVAAGDMFGDMSGTLIFQKNATGEPYFWKMRYKQKEAEGTVGAHNDANWKIIGLADANNDGLDDLLWQKSNDPKAMYVWELKGAKKDKSFRLSFNTNGWKFIGAGNMAK